MFTHCNPLSIASPPSNYSHGIHALGMTDWLYISGQIGIKLNGEIASDTKIQMEECWQHILAVLEDANMTKENLVKVTAYLTDGEDTALYRKVRDRFLDGTKTASTLIIVNALASPDWKVEIEAIAAA